jgi:hypothetical protein
MTCLCCRRLGTRVPAGPRQNCVSPETLVASDKHMEKFHRALAAGPRDNQAHVEAFWWGRTQERLMIIVETELLEICTL